MRIVVIGGGPGGYVAALRAAQLGAQVTLIEKEFIGGTCLNRGCIPTKALLASAQAMAKARAGEEFGFTVNGEIVPNLARMIIRKEQIIAKLRSGVETLLKKAKVEVVKGTGKLITSDCLALADTTASSITVQVDTDSRAQIIQADKVILATGSEPAHLPGFDFEHPAILTSTSALQLQEIPQSLLVVGAGVIGCEFASFFAELGTDVTAVELTDQMLPLEDKRIAKQFQGIYRKRGIKVLLKTSVDSIVEYADKQMTVLLSDGSQVKVEKMLISVGRVPNSSDLGLEAMGVETDARGFVVVDDDLQTSVDNIYAVGDLNGGILLAHVASYEALIAAENCFGKDRMRDLQIVPSCVYTEPEIASVGLKKDQAIEWGFEPVSGTYRFAALGKAVAMGEDMGYVELIADKESDLLLGANMMGPGVTDVIHEVAVAIKSRLTAKQLGETIHAHPSIVEAIMEAAHDVHGESIHMVY